MPGTQPNFFKERREQLGLSQRAMAQKLGLANSSVASWEESEVVPQRSIAALAAAYEVDERRIERELIAQRRTIEERRAASAAS